MVKKFLDFMIALCALYAAGALLAVNAKAGGFDVLTTDLPGFFVNNRAKQFCPQFEFSYEAGGGVDSIAAVAVRASNNADGGRSKVTFSMASEDGLMSMVAKENEKKILDQLMPIMTLGSRYLYGITKIDGNVLRIDELNKSTRVIAVGDIAVKSLTTLTSTYPTEDYDYRKFSGTSMDALKLLDSGVADVVFISGMEPDVEFMKLDTNGLDYRLISLGAPITNKTIYDRAYNTKRYNSSRFAGRYANLVESKNLLFTTKYSYFMNKDYFHELAGCLIRNEGIIKNSTGRSEANLWDTFSSKVDPVFYGMGYKEWESELIQHQKRKAAPARKQQSQL